MKAFKSLLFLLFTIAAAGSAFGQEKTIVTGNQVWLQYYGQASVSDKWTLLFDGGCRWKEAFESRSKYIGRAGIGYALHPKVRIAAGFAHLGSFGSGNISKLEFRPYQELMVKSKIRNLGLKQRLRIEERFFHPITEDKLKDRNTFNFRFRYALTASIPLFKLSKNNPERLFLLNFGNELFINAGKEISHNVFDQNRIIISPTLQIHKGLKVAFTFNSQFASTSSRGQYRYTNVAWIQVKHKLGFSRNKRRQ